jgi:hypothetical protein
MEVRVGKKSMCLAAMLGVAVAAAKLLLVHWRPGIFMKNLAFFCYM